MPGRTSRGLLSMFNYDTRGISHKSIYPFVCLRPWVLSVLVVQTHHLFNVVMTERASDMYHILPLLRMLKITHPSRSPITPSSTLFPRPTSVFERPRAD